LVDVKEPAKDLWKKVAARILTCISKFKFVGKQNLYRLKREGGKYPMAASALHSNRSMQSHPKMGLGVNIYGNFLLKL